MSNNTLREQNFKDYLINSIGKLVISILFGLVFGYLVYKYGKDEDGYHIAYFWTIFIIVSVVSILMFVIKLVKKIKIYKKALTNSENVSK